MIETSRGTSNFFNSLKKFEVVSSSKVEDIFILETSV